ncbi:threonine-phosphate decarboxylase CobD [Pseudothioclava arenosa]|uniref:threonine-phosphate decarboxylase n=1 Tax=Pseudothioclava arenosa TaxID=1795308 RepID=A0A2A4CLK8_9RHOB|nr:threonine-phosphate decarboxylase CobD [Pseudothioclava arenosa]PCD76883.1 threonine-phosphate decarboxylase [Pseudothioclava arenosa]
MSPQTPPRDHGGNLDAAIARLGGTRADWIDLSTGINPIPYPLPPIPADAWAALPRKSEMAALALAAARAYGTALAVVPLAGAQSAIQLVPHLRVPGCARVLAPTYNEHAGALRAMGWQVEEVAQPEGLVGADLAVVVNPNNPDGRTHAPADLRTLAGQVGFLVVDESFADPEPHLSLANTSYIPSNVLILKSFGKFYGLAGLRLGFALAGPEIAARLRDLAGPWPIAGPAISVAIQALADDAWKADTIARLARDAARLDALALAEGWDVVGGTTLFRTYATPDAQSAQERLARARIWTRIFPYSAHWIRLGLPGPEVDWLRLSKALAGERE